MTVYCRNYIYTPVVVKRNTKFSQDQLPIQGEKKQQDPDCMPLKTKNIRVLVYSYNKLVCYQYGTSKSLSVKETEPTCLSIEELTYFDLNPFSDVT